MIQKSVKLFPSEVCLCFNLHVKLSVCPISSQLVFAGSTVTIVSPHQGSVDISLAFSVIILLGWSMELTSFLLLYKLLFYFWPGWLNNSFISETRNFWQTFQIIFFCYIMLSGGRGVSFTSRTFSYIRSLNTFVCPLFPPFRTINYFNNGPFSILLIILMVIISLYPLFISFPPNFYWPKLLLLELKLVPVLENNK